jgi:hypothetical protein
MEGTLKRWAAERGYHVGWGLPSAIAAARGDVLSRRRSGELDADFFQANLASFESFETPWDGPAMVVVVAMPRPAHTVAFTVGGRQVETLFPPTYVRYQPLFEEVRLDLQEHGLPGARVERLKVPLKSLAARLGLVRYGRDNVTYASEFGSYLQLFGFVTDAPLPLPEGWQPREPELLPECARCASRRARPGRSAKTAYSSTASAASLRSMRDQESGPPGFRRPPTTASSGACSASAPAPPTRSSRWRGRTSCSRPRRRRRCSAPAAHTWARYGTASVPSLSGSAFRTRSSRCSAGTSAHSWMPVSGIADQQPLPARWPTWFLTAGIGDRRAALPLASI